MKSYQLPVLVNVLFIVVLIFFTNTCFAKGLNAEELKALISDKTVESESARGFAAKTYYSPNGSFRKTKRDEFIQGLWYIDSDSKLCKKVEGESTASCRLIVKEGNVWKVYKIPSKPTKPWKHKSIWLKIADGNPDKL